MKACRGFRPKWDREKFLKVQSVLQSGLTEGKLEMEYVKLKCPYLPSHFFRCYFKIKGRISRYIAISCLCSSVCRDITETNRLGEQKGGEEHFVCAYVWRTHPFLSHEGCRATRLKERQSALLNVRVFLQKREERDRKGQMKRSVREKCREWRHCGGDRRVIWVRWTEWWYVNKRVTDTKEMERAREGERNRNCAAFDTSPACQSQGLSWLIFSCSQSGS